MADERLEIDRNALDNELIENPQLIQDVCDECAESIATRDAKKEALETTDAELDAEVRDLLSKNATKATEASIKGMIQTHPKHKQAFEDYNNAKLRAAKAAGLEKAVEVRGKALESLSRLYASGYFAINHTKRSADESQYTVNRQRLAEARRKLE